MGNELSNVASVIKIAQCCNCEHIFNMKKDDNIYERINDAQSSFNKIVKCPVCDINLYVPCIWDIANYVNINKQMYSSGINPIYDNTVKKYLHSIPILSNKHLYIYKCSKCTPMLYDEKCNLCEKTHNY